MPEQFDTSQLIGKKFCYTICVDQYVEGKGYIPSAVFEGIKGHFPMTGKGECAEPWYWGNNYNDAMKVADGMNAKMGIDKKTAALMVAESMRK